jgi:hypothetical protein
LVSAKTPAFLKKNHAGASGPKCAITLSVNDDRRSAGTSPKLGSVTKAISQFASRFGRLARSHYP